MPSHDARRSHASRPPPRPRPIAPVRTRDLAALAGRVVGVDHHPAMNTAAEGCFCASVNPMLVSGRVPDSAEGAR